MTHHIPNLLRRTIAAAAAILALGFNVSAPAQQTVTLSGQTTIGTCTFNGALTVQPNGTLSIACIAATATSAAFSLSTPGTIAINSTGTATVTRSGGTGPLSVTYSVSGASCTAATGSFTIAEGDATPQGITITTNGTVGTCTVALNGGTGNTTPGSPATINVVDPSAPPPPGGCPAIPSNAGPINLPWGYTNYLQMGSGTIGYAAVVPVPSTSTKHSVSFQQQVATFTTGVMTTEISVNKCQGVIDTSVAQCYISTTNTSSMTKLDVYEKPYGSWVDQATLGNRGCWAPQSTGPWYVNVRYTYSSCLYNSSGGCGFATAWQYGAY